MRRVFVLLAVVNVALIVSFSAHAEPRVKHVTLSKETTLVIELVPDLGTRFVFPFVLDEQDEYVPFTSTITNPAFASIREPGRNSFVVTIPPSPAGGPVPLLYSNLFVSVAGYEISVELRATPDLQRHYSDIVFDLADEVRESIIQKAVKQRTLGLEKQVQEKLAGLDKTAQRRAIAYVGKLALSTPKSTAIREEATMLIEGSERFLLYVEKALQYGNFTTLVFQLENKSHAIDVTVLDAKLFVLDSKTGQARPLDVALELPSRVPARSEARGAITIESTLLPDRKTRLQLQVATDKGTVAARW